MATMYKVVGHCAHATVNSPSGRVRQLFFKGQLLPPDVPQSEVNHLLSVKLISPIQVGPAEAAAEPVQDPATAVVQEPVEVGATAGLEPVTEGQASGVPAESGDTSASEAGSDEEAQRAEARAKLQAAGGKPSGRHGQPVWAEYLVTLGYDYNAVAKESKDDLQKLAEQVTSP